jgi:hypothetical protein
MCSLSFQALYEKSKRPQNHLHHELPYRYYDEAQGMSSVLA